MSGELHRIYGTAVGTCAAIYGGQVYVGVPGGEMRPAKPAPPPPPRERIDVAKGVWIELDPKPGKLPWSVNVCTDSFSCMGYFDGKHVTRSILGFSESGREWLPKIEAALKRRAKR